MRSSATGAGARPVLRPYAPARKCHRASHYSVRCAGSFRCSRAALSRKLLVSRALHGSRRMVAMTQDGQGAIDLDPAPFAGPRFDASEWLQGVVESFPPGVDVGRCLADVETRLQLILEDMDAGLERACQQIAAMVPRAQHEVQSMAADAASLATSVRRAGEDSAKVAAEAAGATSGLAEVVSLSRKLEAALEIIERAASLDQQLGAAQSAFASGDPFTSASLLGRIATTLSAVGVAPVGQDEPGPSGVDAHQRAAELEADVAAQLRVRLTQAAAKGDVELGRRAVAALRSLRGDETGASGASLARGALEAALEAVMGQAASVLSGDEAGAPAARVGSYFAALSRATTRAAAFARAAAPASSAPPATASTHLGGSDSSSAPGVPPAPNLHPSATVSALAGAGRGAQGALSDALKLAMEGAGGRNPALAGVEALAGAVEEAGAWLRTLPEALGVGDVAGEGAQAFLLAALDVALPVLRGVKGYGALERAALQAEVGACLGRAAHADPETFAAAVPGAVREAGAALRAATSRCHAATGMTEGAGMLTAVDAAFVEMCLSLSQSLARISDTLVAAPAAYAPTALRLLGEALRLREEVGRLEGDLREALTDALPVLMERGRPSCPLADMGLFGLAIRVNPKFQAKVEALVASAQDGTQPLLPKARRAVAGLVGKAEEMVSRVLLEEVSMHTAQVPGLAVWAAEDDAASIASSAAFGAYPQAWATAVGEHLMALPQALEGLDAGEGEGGSPGPWLGRLARTAAEAAASACAGVRTLGRRGGRQMAADLEYLASVLRALELEPPSSMRALAALCACPPDAFAAEVARWRDLAPGSVQAVAAARGLSS